MKKTALNSTFLAATVLAIVLSAQFFHLFEGIENSSLDWRFKMRKAQVSTSPIAVVEVDDEALEIFGKWPWPRSIFGNFVDICHRAGAKAVLFDVLYFEPDRENPQNDRVFSNAIKKAKNVVSAYSFQIYDENIMHQSESGEVQSETVQKIRLDLPIDLIAKSSERLGFTNSWQDEDGYLRRGILSFDYEDTTYYAIGLEALALYKNIPPEEILKTTHQKKIKAWGQNATQVLINWRGDINSFETYPIATVMDETVPDQWKSQWLKDKIILLGSTALGVYDHRPTPFSPQLPGVFYHANLIDNLIVGDFLTPRTGVWTIVAILLLGILAAVIMTQPNAWISAVSVLLLLSTYWGLGYWLLAKQCIYIELVAPTFSLLGTYLAIFFYRFITEQKEKAGIKKAFGVYVNPHVANLIAKNPEALKLGGELREMTVMFSDVAGFTSISEKLTPQELVQLLNLYLTRMTDTIMQHEGTVDKYEGDAIMAFWGAPLVDEQHATKACLAVLENREKLKDLNRDLAAKGMNQLSARCGLNTGKMNVGNMGSAQKFNYTVMGDSVNLASRLEGANKQYGTYLMISESTYQAAKDAIAVRELDLLRVKGKNIPIRVYELVCRSGELSDAQKRGFEIYSNALELYRKMEFSKAIEQFQKVLRILPDDAPTKTYLERSDDYLKTPPPSDWDGVYIMTTK